MDVCPELDVPAENTGTAPPAAAPAAVVEEVVEEADMEMGMEDSNTTMSDMDMTEMPVPLPAEAEAVNPADEVPTCEELETEFCETLVVEEYEDCCLIDCVEPLQALVVCLGKETTGEDRSDCTIPTCPEPTSGGAATTDATPAPAPASGATGVVSRLA